VIFFCCYSLITQCCVYVFSHYNKKYEYAMHALFTGATGTGDDDCISCAISSDVLQPFFVLAPSEMRNLQKNDAAQCAVKISVSGNQAKRTLTQLGLCEVSLLSSPEEFFASSSSPRTLKGKEKTQPILLLSRRHSDV